MNTDDLIAAMSQDTQARSNTVQVLAMTALPALVVSLGIYFAVLGYRPDLLDLLGDPMVAGKFVLPAVVLTAVFPAMIALTRPQMKVGRGALLILPVLALVTIAFGMFVTPSGGIINGFIGQTIPHCLVSIPMISASFLAATLLAMRAGAVTNPRLGGALAGLVSGGAGTLIYATHCTEDNPLFYGTWYALGIAIVALIGAFLGPRVLRW
ncbi:NrsF family protein [Albirhodobacter sp. R86504]|uniref:NrsF family protein n=1 Tax=Albirhodobacter sp. R86504 TaxID=3093848 RepID=UPI00366CDBC2